jgi:hypothetical protein
MLPQSKRKEKRQAERATIIDFSHAKRLPYIPLLITRSAQLSQLLPVRFAAVAALVYTAADEVQLVG